MYSSEEMERTIDTASQLDERLHNFWMEMLGDDYYPVLMELFSEDKYYDSWNEEDRLAEERERLQKKVLVGTDRLRLINLALDFGRLLGRAEQKILDN